MTDPADELIDYEEDDVQVTATSTLAASTTAAAENGRVESGTAGTDKVVKKGYVGIHSTGFRDFLLKPELLRAIVDCGFEHPSEGALIINLSCSSSFSSCSSTRMHSPGHPWNGRPLPGQIGYGQDGRLCPGHPAADRSGTRGDVRLGPVPYPRACLSNQE